MNESRFKRVMRWVLSEGPQPDEPGLEADEHLGQWVLPDKRGLGEIEPDTPLEKKFWKALEAHYVENDSWDLTFVWSELMELSKAGLYRDWLQPPTGPVYRGMTMKPGKASKVLGIPEDDIKAVKNKVRLNNNGGVYQPIKGIISSWSADCDIAAKGFASLFSGHVSIILKAQCAPNGSAGEFLMNPDKLPDAFPKLVFKDDYSGMPTSEEEEVVSYGPVRWDKAAWAYMDPDELEFVLKFQDARERKAVKDKLCKAVQ